MGFGRRLSERAFARYYPAVLERSERAGMREFRGALLQQATGVTLELGSGTGVNLAHYPSAVTQLVLSEPSPHMVRHLRRELAEGVAAGPRQVRLLESAAERIEEPDGSFDTVVSTLVLCTVDDPARVLDEVARLLRPGGRLLFLEHVREPDGTWSGRIQDLIERPHVWLAAGCHPNRRTESLIGASRLRIEWVEHFRQASLAPTVRPMIRGAAVRDEVAAPSAPSLS